MTSFRRGVKNVNSRLGHILAGAACLVTVIALPPALAQQAIAPDVVGQVYSLRPILFPVPKDNTALLETRRKDADALRARFADCESGLAGARAQSDVIIDKQVTVNTMNLARPLREILDATGLGHLTPPEITERGVQLFAICGVRPASPNDSRPPLPSPSLPEPPRSSKGGHFLHVHVPVPDGWKRIENRYFSFSVPSSFTKTEAHGLDSFVEEYVADGIKLSFDYGIYSNNFFGWPNDTKFQYLKVNDRDARIGTAMYETHKGLPGFPYTTQIHIKLDGRLRAVVGLRGVALSMHAACRSEEEVTLAKKIFNTISFSEQK